MIDYSYNLEEISACPLSFRKTMELRNSGHKQMNRLSFRDIKRRKKNRPLKSRKSTNSVKSLMKTPVKDKKKSWLNVLCSFNASDENLVTSTPIQKAFHPVIPCEIKLRKSNKPKFDEATRSQRKSFTRKISKVSLTKSVESVNETVRLSRSSRVLRSQNSSRKSISNEQIPTSEESKCTKKVPVTPQKQILNVQKSKSVTKPAALRTKASTGHGRKCLGTSLNEVYPITSTPNYVNSTSKCKSSDISTIKKNTVTKKQLQASKSFLSENTNDTAKLFTSSCITLRPRHSLKGLNSAFDKTKSLGKSLVTSQNLTPFERTVKAQKQTTSKKVRKSLPYPQKQTSSKRGRKSMPSLQKQKSSKRGRKSSALSQKKKVFKSCKKSLVTSGGQDIDKSISDIPVDDLALTVHAFRERKVKSEDFKLPRLNTLKRKRNAIDALKKADEGYEDDIYESQKFDKFKELFMDNSDSDISCNIATPKLGFQVTPLIRHRTPVFKDFYSPTEYAISRKVAEECMQKNKNKKSGSKSAAVVPEKKRLEFSQVVSDACEIQKIVEKITEDSDDNNSYFSFC